MPSSSNRSTELEKHLRQLYKIAFVRLFASGLKTQAHFVTQQFAEILDMSELEMVNTLKPVYTRTTLGRLKIAAEIKFWQELEASNRTMRRSDKISSAGNALADTGAALFKVGRGAEAAKFCDWGESGLRFDEKDVGTNICGVFRRRVVEHVSRGVR